MDGPFYVNVLEPFVIADASSVTLSGTLQLISPATHMPILGNNFFNYPGKAVRIRAQGRATSAATPGNLSFGFYYGAATNNTGTSMAGVSYAWTANQANTTWVADIWVRCRVIGTSGTLVSGGFFHNQNAGGRFPINPLSLATAASIDLTAANYITIQASRSGSTAETMQLMDYQVEVLN